MESNTTTVLQSKYPEDKQGKCTIFFPPFFHIQRFQCRFLISFWLSAGFSPSHLSSAQTTALYCLASFWFFNKSNIRSLLLSLTVPLKKFQGFPLNHFKPSLPNTQKYSICACVLLQTNNRGWYIQSSSFWCCSAPSYLLGVSKTSRTIYWEYTGEKSEGKN